MWSRLDDQLIDHRKIFIAGEIIGKDGPGLALALYTIGLLWTNKHLTDGHLPLAVVRQFRHVENPVAIADALVQANLWEVNGAGYVIHDFGDCNFSAAEVKAKRDWDRKRKELYADPDLLEQIRARDVDHCRYCDVTVRWKDRRGPAGGQYDHVQSRGPNTLDNVVTACRRCNMRKGNRSLAAANMKLLTPWSERHPALSPT